MTSLVGLLASATLMFIGGIHVYWSLGGCWPGRSEAELVQFVMGGKGRTMLPAKPLVFVIGVGLCAIGLLPLMGTGLLAAPLATRGWLGWALLAMAFVFGLRGVSGFFEEHISPADPGAPYIRLNRVLYSPLCLALAGLLLLARPA